MELALSHIDLDRSPDHGWREPGGELIPLHRAIRVAIVEGEALVRAAFSALLEDQYDITVVGDAGSGEDAVVLARRVRPDVMLVDAGLPGVDGVEATRRILADPDVGDVEVVVLGASESDEELFDALRAGASGFVVKDTEPSELIEAVRTVAGGEAQLSRSATRRLIAEIAAQPDRDLPRPDRLDELTAREREVMALAAMGLSNREIAERLVVSVATARTHVSRALRKVDARDRAQLVALAYQTGLVHPTPSADGALAN